MRPYGRLYREDGALALAHAALVSRLHAFPSAAGADPTTAGAASDSDCLTDSPPNSDAHPTADADPGSNPHAEPNPGPLSLDTERPDA